VICVDTNVVVRLIVGDDAHQTAHAKALVSGHEVQVATTVLLESAWVLRRLYGFDQAAVRNALAAFLGLDNVSASEPEVAQVALQLSEKGVELADAFHLASAIGAGTFATFDADLRRKATRLAGRLPRVVTP